MDRRKTCSRYEAELPEFQRKNPASKAELQMENIKRQLERSKARMQNKIMRMQGKIMPMQSKIMPMQSKIMQLGSQISGEVVMQRAPSLPQSMPHRYELLWRHMSRICDVLGQGM